MNNYGYYTEVLWADRDITAIKYFGKGIETKLVSSYKLFEAYK